MTHKQRKVILKKAIVGRSKPLEINLEQILHSSLQRDRRCWHGNGIVGHPAAEKGPIPASFKGPVPASFEVATRNKFVLPLVSPEKNSVRYCAWLSVLYWSSDDHRMVKEEDTSLPASSATGTIYRSSGRDW